MSVWGGVDKCMCVCGGGRLGGTLHHWTTRHQATRLPIRAAHSGATPRACLGLAVSAPLEPLEPLESLVSLWPFNSCGL